MRPLVCKWIALAVTLSIYACDDGSSVGCANVAERLSRAAAGETVRVGTCELSGPIVVPAGVHLQGAGADLTILSGSNMPEVLVLTPGETPTRVSDLAVMGEGSCLAVAAEGNGQIALERLEIDVSTGVAMGIQGLSGATLDDVNLRGTLRPETIDRATAPTMTAGCDVTAGATHGLVVVDSEQVVLRQVSSTGFASFGALLLESSSEWTGGEVSTNLHVGLEVWGGNALVEDVAVRDTRQGVSAIEVFGAVFAGGVDVESRGFAVSESDGFGIIHDNAVGAHDGLVVRDNYFVGLWSQKGASQELTGATTEFEGNGFSGLAFVDSTGVSIQGGAVRGTIERVRIEEAQTVRAADGVHLVNSTGALSNLDLSNHGRVGLVLDLEGASTGVVSLESITVSATGTSLGAIAQNGIIEPGWDDGVTRLGDTEGNDASFADTLPVAGAVGPPCFPPVESIVASGLGLFRMRTAP
jgi:hypothetical protein